MTKLAFFFASVCISALSVVVLYYFILGGIDMVNRKKFSMNTPFLITKESECEYIKKSHLKSAVSNSGVIHVISPHVLSPHLIRLQKKSLDLYMESPFEYYVYGGDAPEGSNFMSMWNYNVNEEIERVAIEVGAQFRKIPREIHSNRRLLFPYTGEIQAGTVNSRNADALQFIFRDAIHFCSNNILMLLDADMLLVNKINVTEYIQDYDAVGLQQGRTFENAGIKVSINYLFTGPSIFDMKRLPGKYDIDFNWGNSFKIPEYGYSDKITVDTAGYTYKWLIKHNPKVKWLSHGSLTSDKDDFRLVEVASKWKREISSRYPLLDASAIEVYSKIFLHLRNGCNWMHRNESYRDANKYVYDFMNEFLPQK